MDLKLSEVKFTLPTPGVLIQGLELSRFDVINGLRELEVNRNKYSTSNVHVSADSDDKRQGTITLFELRLPAETEVKLRKVDSNKLSLSLRSLALVSQNLELDIRLNVSGLVDVVALDIGKPIKEPVKTKAPVPIFLRFLSDTIKIELIIPNPGVELASKPLHIKDLSFDTEGHHNLSSIESGTLYLVEIDRKKRELKPTHRVFYEKVIGYTWQQQFHEDHLSFQFGGQVRNLRVGTEGGQNVMPSWLEWLASHYPIPLLGALVGLVLGLFKFILGWQR